MTDQPVEPHCPKCTGKPIADQRKLTEPDFDKLLGQSAILARGAGGQICVCRICTAIYSFRQGFSTFISYR